MNDIRFTTNIRESYPREPKIIYLKLNNQLKFINYVFSNLMVVLHSCLSTFKVIAFKFCQSVLSQQPNYIQVISPCIRDRTEFMMYLGSA